MNAGQLKIGDEFYCIKVKWKNGPYKIYKTKNAEEQLFWIEECKNCPEDIESIIAYAPLIFNGKEWDYIEGYFYNERSKTNR